MSQYVDAEVRNQAELSRYEEEKRQLPSSEPAVTIRGRSEPGDALARNASTKRYSTYRLSGS